MKAKHEKHAAQMRAQRSDTQLREEYRQSEAQLREEYRQSIKERVDLGLPVRKSREKKWDELYRIVARLRRMPSSLGMNVVMVVKNKELKNRKRVLIGMAL